MNKMLKLVALLIYLTAALAWEAIRLLWWLWNLSYLVWSRRHSKLEIGFRSWLCQWPSLDIAECRLRNIMKEG